MVNKESITQDLIARKLTQGEIARKNNCSITTVQRLAREEGLGLGRGRKNYWEFTQSSEALAYIIGAYLTDGFVRRSYRTKEPTQFSVSVTSYEFVAQVERCLDQCGLKPKRQQDIVRDDRLPRFTISTYCSMFATWIHNQCRGKAQIPDYLFSVPFTHQLAFLAGIIDGDGHVTKDGSIKIRGIDDWIKMLPTLLEHMQIRSSGLKVSELLKSGKAYFRVSIRRSDFRDKNGWCAIPEKQYRIVHAVETRTDRHPKRQTYVCPICGQNKMTIENAESCRECYLSSERLHQHLVNIAPKGGKAGNEARWHK